MLKDNAAVNDDQTEEEYSYGKAFSSGTVFRRHNLTSVDVRF